MAKWLGTPKDSALELTQAEFDRLPQCIKFANNDSPIFSKDEAYLALVGLPYLLKQYEVTRHVYSSSMEGGNLGIVFSSLFNRLHQDRPLIYQKLMEERCPWKPFPQAGDAVQLTGTWDWAGSLVRLGDIGIIGGRVGVKYDDLSVTWHPSSFRGWSSLGGDMIDLRSKYSKDVDDQLPEPVRDHVSCSGGPATIALPTKLLRPTEETTWVRYWCWHDMPRANSAVHYQLEVPVWNWDGKGY
jgi:hypothetical protein